MLEERDSPCVDSVHLALVQRDDRVLRSSSSTLGEATTGEGLAGDDSGGPSPPEQDVSDATASSTIPRRAHELNPSLANSLLAITCQLRPGGPRCYV